MGILDPQASGHGTSRLAPESPGVLRRLQARPWRWASAQSSLERRAREAEHLAAVGSLHRAAAETRRIFPTASALWLSLIDSPDLPWDHPLYAVGVTLDGMGTIPDDLPERLRTVIDAGDRGLQVPRTTLRAQGLAPVELADLLWRRDPGFAEAYLELTDVDDTWVLDLTAFSSDSARAFYSRARPAPHRTRRLPASLRHGRAKGPRGAAGA